MRYRVKGSDYCIEHQYLQRRDDELERNKPFYKNARHNQWQTMYASPRWKEMQSEKLRDCPYCEICGEPATEVHHIQAHNGDVGLFFDRTNLQSLCHSCHCKQTQRESEARKQRPKFVRNPRNRKLWF